jgi:Fuc2NAc and GlcNAc transferase
MVPVAVALLSAAAASWALTAAVRRYALARGVLDIPNERSSHERPTPRGGGAAIVAVVLFGTAAGAAAGLVPVPVAAALIPGGLVIAAIGWIDDHVGLSRWPRAAVHTAAAVWAVLALGGLDSVRLGTVELDTGFAGTILAVVGVVWAINLYNFMDGIDGLAAGEAMSVGAFGALLALVAGAPGIGFVAALVAAAATGFLTWNWAPARIFMGDVGSGFLGFAFGTLAVASETLAGPPLLCWLLLLAVFVFDATVTLARRFLRGEPWYKEHRSHAYQRAHQASWSAARVTAAALAMNVGLAALAAAGLARPAILPAGALIAIAGLALVYLAVERRRPMAAR